jgi:LysM repeat protein
MVRSAAALLAFLIFPGIALAQQAQGTHTVVDGDTLWDLAETYYGDPFDWRRIWNANQAQIADPNLIEPGQVFVIPGTDADPEETTIPVVTEDPEPEEAVTGNGLNVRTIFYQDTSAAAVGAAGGPAVEYLAVPRDLAYSAPRVLRSEGDPPHAGILDGAANGSTRHAIVRSYDRVHVTMESPARVGDQLQVFSVGDSIESVGRVLYPTGVLSVSEIVEDGVIALVTKVYARVVAGQFVGPMPQYSLSEGEYAEDVSGGDAAMVLGFANTSTIQDIGFIAFVDLGSDAGVTLGDEFSLFNTTDTDFVEGRLQVVGVQDGIAAARILNISSPVFERGVVVRLTKKMR